MSEVFNSRYTGSAYILVTILGLTIVQRRCCGYVEKDLIGIDLGLPQN